MDTHTQKNLNGFIITGTKVSPVLLERLLGAAERWDMIVVVIFVPTALSRHNKRTSDLTSHLTKKKTFLYLTHFLIANMHTATETYDVLSLTAKMSLSVTESNESRRLPV